MSTAAETLWGWVSVIIVVLVIGSAVEGGKAMFGDWFDNRPQLVDVDGQTFYACGGVSVRADGGMLAGDTFQVQYKDSDGLSHTYRGVKKVRRDDIPTTVTAPLPTSNALQTSDGKPYEVGSVYTWSDGHKGKFTGYDMLKSNDNTLTLDGNGKPIPFSANWAPVQEPNTICNPTKR
jgi:hypothetical protein